MHHSPGPRRRVSARARVLAPLAIVATAALAAAPAAAFADTAATPPAYTAASTTHLNGGLLSDIAGSAFVDEGGQFHFTNAYTGYADDPTQGWANTFTNTDLGAVNAGYGTTTQKTVADAFYATPGSLCYQLDKRSVDPVPSPQEDDHCDIIGVWVDPHTGTWHAMINDEFQFDPWQTKGADATVAQKISTGNHNNRILLATSDDKGKSWHYAGAALTSGWDADGIITSSTSPNTSYPFGDSGIRLFVDYSSGYFYLTYNVKIYKKPASSTLASWTEMARAPISGGMASGTWEKWYDGSWSQPGIGGIDGNVNSIGGLNVSYDPATDEIAWSGSGASATASYQAATVPSSHLVVFSDVAGNTYTANTLAHTIVNNATGQAAPDRTVTYTDQVTGQDVTVKAVDDVYVNGVKTVTGGIYVTQADPKSGASQTVDLITGSAYYEDPGSHHFYLPSQNNESAISYDAYSGSYRIVGYDGNVYETADLGDPNSWKVVGTMPANSDGGYLTSLDDGSLTNQNVTGSSFLTVSDLSGAVTTVVAAPQTGSTSELVPVDAARRPVRADASYRLSIGNHAVGPKASNDMKASWSLVPVSDPYSHGDSGFYRLQNKQTGQYLQIGGGSVEAQRAMGATATTGAQQPNFDPAGDGGNGTPGGSDQWYLQMVATCSDPGVGHHDGCRVSTSLAGSTTYRLVNRNSGLALEYSHGRFRLAQQRPGDAGQYVTFVQRR